MRTPEEILDEVAQEKGWRDFSDMLYNFKNPATPKIIISEAVKKYAQQFIDLASSIIDPAVQEILPEEYKADLDRWYAAIKDHDDTRNG